MQQNLQRLSQDYTVAWSAVLASLPGQTTYFGRFTADPISSTAVTLVMLIFLFRIWRARPAWLGERATRQVPLLLAVVFGGFLVQVPFTIWLLRLGPGVDWRFARVLISAISTSLAAVHFVAYSLLWACVLQIARRGRCSYMLAIRTGLIVWLPMLAFYAVLRVPSCLMQCLNAFPWVPFPLWATIVALLGPAMMLVPWLIVQYRLGFLEALERQVAMLAKRPRVILPFVLRTVLIFTPLQFLAQLLSRGGVAASTVQLLLMQLTGLLAMAVVALWLLELEKQARTLAAANEPDDSTEGASVL